MNQIAHLQVRSTLINEKMISTTSSRIPKRYPFTVRSYIILQSTFALMWGKFGCKAPNDDLNVDCQSLAFKLHTPNFPALMPFVTVLTVARTLVDCIRMLVQPETHINNPSRIISIEALDGTRHNAIIFFTSTYM